MKSLIAALALTIASPAFAADEVYAEASVDIAHGLADELHGSVGRIADTGSMEPTLTHRDMVVFVPGLAPRVGDIVVFRLFGAVVCHRIIEASSDGWYVTKGDHNKGRDPAIARGQILGVAAIAIDGPTGLVRSLRGGM